MTAQDERRESAIRKLKQKQGFRGHLAVYVLVNTMLIVIWAATGAGFFWPIWPIAGWGIGLALNAYRVYFGPKALSEREIRAEMDRQDQRTSPQRPRQAPYPPAPRPPANGRGDDGHRGRPPTTRGPLRSEGPTALRRPHQRGLTDFEVAGKRREEKP